MTLAVDPVRETLAPIRSGGSFAASLEVPSAGLRLDVKGVGPLSFPLSETKARSLCSVALLAQHGFKDETRLDTKVRNTWEVPKSRVKIEQRRWNETLVPALDQLRSELGLTPNCTLRAELHNLLVYAPGQFFVPHQDAEKEDGMIGTLVVTLPSTFSGGALSVKHHDKKLEYRGAGRRLSFVAFYADCHHEVSPVKNGFRIVLTYNLLLSQGKDNAAPPASEAQLGALEGSLREFFATVRPPRWHGAQPEPPPDRLVYLLDHQYSRTGLAWDQLKGDDRARVAALREVAARLDCDTALALADVHETWTCEDDADRYAPSWRRSSRYSTRVDEPDASDDSHPTLSELGDSEVELRHLVDARGKGAFVSGHVEPGELCFTKPSMNLDPFRSEHTGFMGNWGNTVDRWYHRAAVVLWPRRLTFLIRAKSSAKYALDELAKSVRTEGTTNACSKAEALRPHWPRVWRAADDPGLVSSVLRVSLELGSKPLALDLLAPLQLEHLTPRVAPLVVSLLHSYGGAWFDQVLNKWQSERGYSHERTRIEWLAGLERVVRALTKSSSAAPNKLAQKLVRRQWEWLQTRYAAASKLAPSAVLKQLRAFEKPLLALLQGSQHLHAKPFAAVQRFLRSGELPVLALVHLLETARQKFDLSELDSLGFAPTTAHCARVLEKRLARPARAAGDWSITPPGGCSCQLCGELAKFLIARNEASLEWPLAQHRRAHIHHVVERHELPLTHTTRRAGRPYVLVLTKTQALFEHEAAERSAWERALRALRGKRAAS